MESLNSMKCLWGKDKTITRVYTEESGGIVPMKQG